MTSSSPSSFLSGLQIYILPSKIEPSELKELDLLITLNGGTNVKTAGEADLVLSRAKGKARMALSLPEEIFVSFWMVSCDLGARGQDRGRRRARLEREGGRDSSTDGGADPPSFSSSSFLFGTLFLSAHETHRRRSLA